MYPFISKHDPTAYRGKMDKLTFSNLIKSVSDRLYDEVEELTNSPLVDLRVQAKNEAILHTIKQLEQMAEKVLDPPRSEVESLWNVSAEEFERGLDDVTL